MLIAQRFTVQKAQVNGDFPPSPWPLRTSVGALAAMFVQERYAHETVFLPAARSSGHSKRIVPMLTRFITAAALATLAVAAPVAAQSSADDARFRTAQDRFDREYQTYRQEVDRYQAARGRGGYSSSDQGYRRAPDQRYASDDDRYDPNYDASRYYRSGNYQERALSADDRVYAGNDGRYYCKRSDGTTGLIVGAAGGGVLGNVIDGGHSRTVGTLLGAAIGGLAGRAVDQNNSQVRCR